MLHFIIGCLTGDRDIKLLLFNFNFYLSLWIWQVSGMFYRYDLLPHVISHIKVTMLHFFSSLKKFKSIHFHKFKCQGVLYLAHRVKVFSFLFETEIHRTERYFV